MGATLLQLHLRKDIGCAQHGLHCPSPWVWGLLVTKGGGHQGWGHSVAWRLCGWR